MFEYISIIAAAARVTQLARAGGPKLQRGGRKLLRSGGTRSAGGILGANIAAELPDLVEQWMDSHSSLQ